MKILIVNLSDRVEVRVIDDQGITIRKFTYRDLLAARRAASSVSDEAGRVNAALFAVGNRCGYPTKGCC